MKSYCCFLSPTWVINLSYSRSSNLHRYNTRGQLCKPVIIIIICKFIHSFKSNDLHSRYCSIIVNNFPAILAEQNKETDKHINKNTQCQIGVSAIKISETGRREQTGGGVHGDRYCTCGLQDTTFCSRITGVETWKMWQNKAHQCLRELDFL